MASKLLNVEHLSLLEAQAMEAPETHTALVSLQYRVRPDRNPGWFGDAASCTPGRDRSATHRTGVRFCVDIKHV